MVGAINEAVQGGGGENVFFIVNLIEEYDEETGEYKFSVDKTTQEMWAAAEAGRIVFLSAAGKMLQVDGQSESHASFSITVPSEDNESLVCLVVEVDIDGTVSVEEKGITPEVPIADGNNAGIVKVYTENGIMLDTNNRLRTVSVTDSQLAANNRKNQYRIIPASKIDLAVKNCMCDGSGPEWTETEQAGAQARLGLVLNANADGIQDDSAVLNTAFNKSNAVIDGQNKKYKIKYISIVSQHDLVIRNFIFTGGIQVKLSNCHNILFENCVWEDFYDNNVNNADIAGIILTHNETSLTEENRWGYDTICKNITFDKCTFSNICYSDHWTSTGKPHYSTGMAINLRGADGINIQNCKFTQIKGNACIYVNTHGWIGDFDFHDNLFYLNGWAGIEFYRCNVLTPTKRRTIHNNRFIGCGLGYIPEAYFNTYYSAASEASKTGVGTAAMIGLNYPLYNNQGYNDETNRCSMMCEVSNNVFIDNNESSIEGSAWTPVLNNHIVGIGAFQTEESRLECIQKYDIDYYTRVRLNPSCNAFYSSGREHNERDEAFIIRNNTVSRLEGVKGFKNPVVFQGQRKKPFLFENNHFGVLPGQDKYTLITKSDFKAGMTWRNNDALPPFFNATTIRKNYYLDDITDMYACTFTEDAYIEVPNTDRFPQVHMTELDEKVCTVRNVEVAKPNSKNQLTLTYKVLDDNVEPLGTPIYAISEDERYDEELGGVTFDGTNGIDTGISLFDNNQDFTIIVKYQFDNICNHGSGSLIKYPNYTYFPVVSCMNYKDSANGYPGFDIGLMFDDSSGTEAYGGYQRFRNHWSFGNSAALSTSNEYIKFYNKVFTYIIIKKDGVISCYNAEPLSQKIKISGKAATTVFDGNLCIGKNMIAPEQKGKPYKTDEQFKGIIYQCDVYDHAVSAATLETIYPTFEDTEATLKGAATIYLKNNEYAKHTIRALNVDICYNLVNSPETGNEAFEIRLINNIAGNLSITDDSYVHRIRKIIPVQQYGDTIQPFGKYGVQIINTSRNADMKIEISSIKITAITKRAEMAGEEIKLDDFDVVWDKDISDLAIGEKVSGSVSAVYPSNAVLKDKFTLSVDDDTIIKGTGSTKTFEIMTLAEGIGTCTISCGTLTKDYVFNITDKPVHCTGLSVSPTSKTIYKNQQLVITPIREPINCNQEVTWTTSDDTICSVDNGLVTGLKGGSCVITAICESYQAETAITVVEKAAPTDESWDMTSFIGYLPIDDVKANHSGLFEIDRNNYPTNSPVSNATNIITTKAYNASSGLGIITAALTSGTNKFLIRDAFTDDAADITSVLSNRTRKSGTGTASYDAAIWSNNKLYQRTISTNTWMDNTSYWSSSTGALSPFNKALYFNVGNATDNIVIENQTESALESLVAQQKVTPAVNNKGTYVKNYIIFDDDKIQEAVEQGVKASTYMIEHRDEALIDIRMGTDGKLHNYGTAGELIYTSIAG